MTGQSRGCTSSTISHGRGLTGSRISSERPDSLACSSALRMLRSARSQRRSTGVHDGIRKIEAVRSNHHVVVLEPPHEIDDSKVSSTEGERGVGGISVPLGSGERRSLGFFRSGVTVAGDETRKDKKQTGR